MKGKNVLLLLGGILAGILLGAALLYAKALPGSPPSAARPVLEAGAPAPDFALAGLDGQAGRLSNYRGKAVVINFWATWCAPCKKEMPLLESAYQEYSPELVILGVNAGETAPVAGAFVDEMGITFPVFLDESGRTGADYHVRGYPTTFFIDSGGVMRSMHIGELNEKQLAGYLAEIGLIP